MTGQPGVDPVAAMMSELFARMDAQQARHEKQIADLLAKIDAGPHGGPVDDSDPRWEMLRAPFPTDEIEKLPKQLKSMRDQPNQPRGKCEKPRHGNQFDPSFDGVYCGGYHGRAVHLDYVGHAGVTERLNKVDPWWNYTFMSVLPDGTPNLNNGRLWINLTVLGVTRPGVGDADGKSGPAATKEMIGDAIRNAAMRFGVAIHMWSKSERAQAIRERGDEDAPGVAGDGDGWQQLEAAPEPGRVQRVTAEQLAAQAKERGERARSELDQKATAAVAALKGCSTSDDVNRIWQKANQDGYLHTMVDGKTVKQWCQQHPPLPSAAELVARERNPEGRR